MPNASYALAAEPVEVISTPGAQLARATCSRCGAKDDWRIARLPPPDMLHRHFTVKGWEVKRRTICPDCLNKKEPKMASVTPIKQEPAPSAEIRAMRRKVNELLDGTFDVAKGVFIEGYSDERISKESGMPVGWVTKRREDEYGPLREPSEFGEIRKEAAELASAIGKLQAKLDAMSKRNGWSA